MTQTVMLIAGEASGDMHGAELARRLQQHNIRCIGMGSRHMQTAGVELIVDSSGIAVVGLFEVLAHWSEIQSALKTMRNALAARRPDLLVLIDYPEFNLKLAAAAKSLGIPVLFYVSPQVWAWRPKRVHKIGRVIDHMAVIFPFEVDVYRRANIPVTYVGHPLAQRVRAGTDRETALRQFGLNPQLKTVALMPGSRHSEIQRLLPTLISAAEKIRDHMADAVQFVLPVAPTLDTAELKKKIGPHGIDIRLITGRTYDAINASDIAITASGTATLEIALLQTPMIVIYKVSPLSYAILRRLITVPQIALANIVAGRQIVPELIQSAATPDNIAQAAVRQLTDTAYHQRIKQDLAVVKHNLGILDGIQEMTVLILKLLANPPPGTAKMR
ncbi:MAG TPA: lipid-A-disaccharide synthase [Gammaproteobacteria bacterium]